MTAPRRRGRSAGSALLEALVALALVGVALLFLVGLLVHDLRLAVRGARQREAFASLEAAVAGLRAGALPLQDGQWTPADAPDWLVLPEGDAVELAVAVEEDERDLWTVVATVRYAAWNEPQSRTLVTRIWSPAAGG